MNLLVWGQFKILEWEGPDVDVSEGCPLWLKEWADVIYFALLYSLPSLDSVPIWAYRPRSREQRHTLHARLMN